MREGYGESGWNELNGLNLPKYNEMGTMGWINSGALVV